MEAFRFYSWHWLALTPLIMAIVWWRSRRARQPAALFSSVADLKGLPTTWAQRVRRWLPLPYTAGLLLIVAALARPQWGQSQSRITGEGIAIELVLDVSGSMEALDFQLEGEQVDRLAAVKQVISDFVLGSRRQRLAGRKNDLIGLIAFGGFADSKCPLTLDHGALVDIVKGLDVPKAVRDRRGRIVNESYLQEELATAIGDGVALAIDRLRNAQARSKVIVLLTDGDNNAGVVDPREAAKLAQQAGIKIYTVGIGRDGIVPIPQEDEFGKRFYVRAQFRVDEALLREMAQSASGEYFHASDTDGLARVYAQIDQLEKSQFEETKYAEYNELFSWFAGPGLVLIGAVAILRETRLGSIP